MPPRCAGYPYPAPYTCSIGASSVQTVENGEYLEFEIIGQPNNYYAVGLSYNDMSYAIGTINYAWFVAPDYARVYKDGAFQSGGIVGSENDAILRIARDNGTVRYYKDGVLIYSLTDTYPSNSMVVDIAMRRPNSGSGSSKIYNLRVGKLKTIPTYEGSDYVAAHGSEGDYRYGFNGMEADDEVKSGTKNSYDFGARLYDPRVGRWLSTDRLESSYPSSSTFCYALNSPIMVKDEGGFYTIFVNGYIHGQWPGSFDDITPGYEYWRSSKSDPGQFINSAHDYFGDGLHKFVNGTGEDMTSLAQARQFTGYQ